MVRYEAQTADPTKTSEAMLPNHRVTRKDSSSLSAANLLINGIWRSFSDFVRSSGSVGCTDAMSIQSPIEKKEEAV